MSAAIERVITNDPFGSFENPSFAITTDKDTFEGPDGVKNTSHKVINIERANSGSLEVEGIASDTTISFFTLIKLASGLYARVPFFDGEGAAVTLLIQSADGEEQIIPLPASVFGARNLVLEATVAISNSRVTLKS